MLRQASNPTKNVNTFHGLLNDDMESTVMINDE